MRLLALVSLLALLVAPVAQAADLQPGDLVAPGQHQDILRIDPQTGDRTTISGCADPPDCTTSIGSGPTLNALQQTVIDLDGSLIAQGGACIYRVDPATGDRTLLAGAPGPTWTCPHGPLGSGPPLYNHGLTVVPLLAPSVSAIGDWGTLVMAGMLALLMVREMRQRFRRRT